jgi:Uroporphyrinogen decarboxylase (URO-D)
VTNTMSSRERMLAAIRREGPDHIPFSPYIGQGPGWQPPLFWRNQIERAQKMLALDLDPTIDIRLPDPQPHPDVRIKTWREQKADDTLIVKEYHTPAGVLRQVVRETDDWCSIDHGLWQPTTWGNDQRDHFGMDLFDDWNVSRRLEPWVKGREDLDKLRYIIRPVEGHLLDEWLMDARRAMACAKQFDVLTMARRTIVGDAFEWFCDIPWFMLQLHDDHDFVEQFLDIFQQWSLPLVDMALAVGVDVVQYRGWYESPTFWGLPGWRKHLVPRIEAQARRVHAAGKLHGYLNPEGHGVYAQTLADMSCDVLLLIDPRMLHRGTLQEVFDALGQSKAFWGGVNAEVVLQSQDAAQIDRAVREAVDILGANSGLILSAFLFQNITPHASIMHLIEAWRKHCHPE